MDDPSQPPPQSPPPTPGVFSPPPPRGVLPQSATSSAEAALAREFNRALHELTPTIWATWLLIAANVAVYGIMIAKGVDPMTPKITDLLKWGANCGIL